MVGGLEKKMKDNQNYYESKIAELEKLIINPKQQDEQQKFLQQVILTFFL